MHRITNHGFWPVEVSPWAVSVMASGGTAILPIPPRGTHPEILEPTNPLILWAYTDMTDPRWTWGHKYITLRQDTSATTPQKIGAGLPDGWLAYANHEHLFVKTFGYTSGATYPDLGSSVELFTNPEMLEMETLGPVTKLEPGASVEHVECWFLFRDVPMPTSEADIDVNILPLVKSAQSRTAV